MTRRSRSFDNTGMFDVGRYELGSTVSSPSFFPRDAMLARVIAIATCLSVRLSVCLSRAGIVSKRRKLAA